MIASKRPLLSCSVICLFSFNDMPFVISISLLIVALLFSFLLSWRLSCFPSLYLLLNPSFPHVPLHNPFSPPLPSQTNGAHNRLTKNSHAAKSVHFFFPAFLSFLFLMFLFFLFSKPPCGGKWVTGRRLVSSFISWQPMCSSLRYQGWAAEAVGPWARDRAPGCLSAWQGSRYTAIELGAWGKMNVWTEFMGSWTSPSGQARGVKSPGEAGGRHCAKRMYHAVRMDGKSLRQVHE